MDELKPTPRNKLLGLIADNLREGLDFATYNGQNKPMNMLSELLALPAIQKTADRLSYGEPLTTGKGFTTRLQPETFDAAMGVLPFAGSMGRGANYAAEGLNKGAAMIGKAAAPSTERLVNAVMAKGGLPAQLMQDMAQGTKSHIFIGQNAKNFDKNNLAQALKMEKEGVDPRQIWSETGSMKAPWDKQWRQEIDDSVANIPYSPDRSGRADMFVKHPELFDNYPSMSGMSFGVDSQSMGPLNGSYIPSSDAIKLGSGNTSTGLHELQHAIQGREGFARGGSEFYALKITDDLPLDQLTGPALDSVKAHANKMGYSLSKKQEDDIAEQVALGLNSDDSKVYQLGRDTGLGDDKLADFFGIISPTHIYRRLAGEAEARAVQARMNMDAGQRRATYPLDSFDVPVDQLITRFGDNGPQMATVWHGSPHKFAPTPNNPLGEFDFSKIGTGEGAQAYGHGGYLGGAKATGESYRDLLSSGELRLKGGGEYDPNNLKHISAATLDEYGGDTAKAIKNIEAKIAQNKQIRGGERWNKDLIDQLNQIKLGGLPELENVSNGYLYKVDLPDEQIAKMLDWDKPLSGQPANVQEAWSGLGKDWGIPNNPSEMIGNTMNRAMLEKELQKRGVPGVRYLDGGSRINGSFKITPPNQTVSGKWMVKGDDYNSKGMHFDSEAEALAKMQEMNNSATRNYVVFPGNERLLKILERNGQSLP